METKDQPTRQAQIPVAVVRKLLHRGARTNLARVFSKAYPVEVARLLSVLGGAERSQAFSILLDECEISHAAATLSEMAAEESVSLLENLDPKRIARLLGEMAADDATYLTSRLPSELASQALASMEAEPAADVRELLEHDEKTAGRMMTREFFALEEDVTIAEAIAALQRRSEELEMVFYLFVVDKRDHLVGVISLRKLLTTPPSYQLKKIMVPSVISAKTTDSQEEVARLVSEYNLLAIPVVDEGDRLVGIVTVDDVLDVVQEEVAEDLLALSGVAAEEHVNTTAGRSLRLRAPWLLINLATASLAALVIAEFETPIKKEPVLAALMPIVAGLGGNAATQALTVIIRGIALGEINSVSRIAIKSVLVGAGNGVITGLVGAGFVSILLGNIWFGVILAAAMIINMIIGGLAATLVPLTLRKMHVDPALSSSIFVTACTDVFGFLSFLGLATLLINWLT